MPNTASSRSGTSGSATSGTGTVSGQQAALRRDLETLWLKWWGVFYRLDTTPVAARQALIESVSSGPAIDLMTAGSASADKSGVKSTGVIKHHLYWGPFVAGSEYAYFGDCLDQSGYKVVDRKTGKVVKVGIAYQHAKVVAKRTSAGWRIDQIQNIGANTCKP